MKQMRLSRWTGVLYGLLAILMLVIVVYIGIHEKVVVSDSRDTGTPITIDDYQYMEKEDAQALLGYDRVYRFTLDDEIREGDCSLVFYVVHHNVRVYFDDELVYSLQPDDKNRMVHTVGCTWVSIPLRLSDRGKTIRVELAPVYTSVRERKTEFLIGSSAAIARTQLKKDFPQLFVGLIAILTGLIFTGCACADQILVKKGHKSPDMDFWYLGFFSILMGIWKISDTRFISLQFPSQAVMLSYLALAALMLLGVPFLMIVQSQNREKQGRFCYVLSLVSMVTYLGIAVLQILGLLELRAVLWMIQGWLGVYAVFIIFALIYRNVKGHGTRDSYVPEGMFVLCAVGIIADLSCYYIKGNSTGVVFTMSAFLIYIVVMGIIRIVGYLEQEKKLKEQEAELATNRISIMLSQIQPHFLYNSLNTIYHLCVRDPKRAQRAISDFSDYLRGNLDALTQTSLIDFEQELKHVRIYLSLEKMRFDDKLEIAYDIRITDFRIPPLTVQPLVENAVKHGISKKDGGGILRIVTDEQKDGYVILVYDNGNGYDESVICEDGRSHIGISNVRSRLWELCHASLSMESTLGKGTCVRIWIPKTDTNK